MAKFSLIILPHSSGYPPTCCWGGIHRSTTAFYRIHPRLKKPWYSAKADKPTPAEAYSLLILHHLSNAWKDAERDHPCVHNILCCPHISKYKNNTLNLSQNVKGKFRQRLTFTTFRKSRRHLLDRSFAIVSFPRQ